MGRVRTHTIKSAAKKIISLHYKKLDYDFYHNVKVVQTIAIIQSKRLRNQVAGYVTHLMKRIQKSTVPGVNIKEHEEERERKENFIPKNRILDEESVVCDKVTMRMLAEYGIKGNYVSH